MSIVKSKVKNRKDDTHNTDFLKMRKWCERPHEPNINQIEELDKHRYNIRTIMKHSNATPFKAYHVEEGFACCFCDDFFRNAADLKRHTIEKHDSSEKDRYKENSTSLFTYVVKLDVTGLSCNLCNLEMNTLEELIAHFEIHEIILNDIKNQIVCFKFIDDVLRCMFCFQEFSNFKFLLEHKNDHYRNFVCGDCNSGFINFRMLLAHCDGQDLTIGEVKCPLCAKVFSSLTTFKKHEILAHSGFDLNTHKCTHCGEVFESDESLCDHVIKEHQGRHEYVCDCCKKTYSTKNLLVAHTKRVHLHEEKDFKCDVCGKCFFEPQRLMNHMMRHTETRKFQCDTCTKMFKHKETLVRHIRTHKLKGRFQCLACEDSFFRKSYLDDHVKQVHMNQKRLKCDHCDKLFYQSQLKHHISKRHPEFSTFKCEECSEVFISKFLLVQHMSTHGVFKPKTKNFECLACGKKFDRKIYVMKHTQRVHLLEKRFVCDHCGKSFADTTALKNHVATHSAINQFQCFGCPRTFKTKKTMMNHARNHMEEKKVKCDICQQGFIYPYLLKEHMKNVHKIIQ